MRCWNCGEILDPEMRRRCPYCGKRIRPDEQEHREGKKPEPKIKTETETESNLDGKATVRKISIVVIVLAVCGVLGYVICRNVMKSQNTYKENIEQIEACLEAEDYLMLYRYYNEWDAIYRGREEYDSYVPVLRLTWYYKTLYEDILDYALAAEENKDDELQMLVTELQSYHREFNYDHYRYFENSDIPENRQHIANMLETVDHMLIVYCGFTEEETRQIDDMSELELYRIFDSR